MKILFAVSNESISKQIVKKYESLYKEIVSSENVYYFNAVLKELKKDKEYDRIVISEDLEPFSNNNHEITDNFIFEKLDRISDEAVDQSGEDIPIILIASDRRTAGENILSKLFSIGVYSVLLGQDRTIPKLCELINKPRTKKEAKIYYKIDAKETDYKAESENDVSELEIQNILAHYKRLGKNEEKYVESFNSITNQYNDQQLKVIIKFLPIGVKAVLEAKSPKYQQLAAFSGESSSLKNQKPYKSSQINPRTNKPRSTQQAIFDNGIKIESINSKDSKRPSKPVIIPATMSTKNVKKIQKEDEFIDEIDEIDNVENIDNQRNLNIENNQENDTLSDLIDNMEDLVENTNNNVDNIDTVKEHRRGRPRKVLTPEQLAEIEEKNRNRRGRGRPRKIDISGEKNNTINSVNVAQIDKNQDDDDFDFEFDFEDDINDNDNSVKQINNETETINVQQTQDNNHLRIMDGEDEQEEDNNKINLKNENNNLSGGFLPGFDLNADVEDNLLLFDEPDILHGFENVEDNDGSTKAFNITSNNEQNSNSESNKKILAVNKEDNITQKSNLNLIEEYDDIEEKASKNYINKSKNNYEYENNNVADKQIQKYDNVQNNSTLSGLISSDKKVVSFVGTSKNGTSFLVNSLADIFSRQGIKTAIVDLTKNRNDYYIYTKNEEELRKTATECMRRLAIGSAQGIKVNNYLDVYTSLPGDKFDESLEEYDKVLNTLIENYSLILLDCDFNTNYGYLKESQEIYLVQSMDVLTIQPLTAYLRDLKAKNIYEPEKLKIVINKYAKVRSVTERTIIGGMAFYNDPSMSFMSDELFNREKIRYCVIPFDVQTYTKYLEGIINCNISTNGYSRDINLALNKLAGIVFPLITGNAITKTKKQNYNNYQTGKLFSNKMNDTLGKMKNNF